MFDSKISIRCLKKIKIIFMIYFISGLIPLITFGQGLAGDKPVSVDKSDANFDIRNTTMTRWVDPNGSQPITYEEWKARTGDTGPFQMELITKSSPPNSERKGVELCVIINSTLYNQVQSSVDQYVLDLTGEGYDVELYTTLGGSAEDLRTFLQGEYADGLLGCVLIGDLPVPWYETDFGDPPAHAEFPIDLFYMDMDGVFADTDVDGKYDSHTGNVFPEIYVGRLTASPLTLDGVNEVGLIQNYFYKNHLYRCDLFPVSNRALVYIDDDWAPGDWWNTNVGEAYRNRTFIRDRWETWSPDYESRLPQDYEFIQVCVHSWPGGHGFKNPDDDWSWTYVDEIKAIQPVAHFYNLFACSNARYVETDYCGGWYTFGENHGLASLGSTKSGSMLYFDDFYQPFGQGESIGKAFQDWFAARAAGGFEEWEISWFYGMTLIGDPTLLIQQKPNGERLQFDNGSASYMMSLPDPGDWDMFNVRFSTAIECTLSSVSVTGIFPESPMRMYIWNSDGTYPASKIDSVDIPNGDLGYIDVYDLQIDFKEGDDFHVGFTCLDPTPIDTHWIYMDNGVPEQNRSCLSDAGVWKTLHEAWGTDYNFLIRVEVRHPPDPEVKVTTTSLPDGKGGLSYSTTVEAEGGLLPYNWDITAGNLPDGLNLEPATGTISGSATAIGIFPFTVRAADSDSPSLEDVQHLSIVIDRSCGDTDNDGTINIFDISYLITYLYMDGPAPDPLDMGDANNDGDVNIFDITHIIAFLYSGGPEPICD
jgi:hypothetical protein